MHSCDKHTLRSLSLMSGGTLGVTALPQSFKSFSMSTADSVAVKLWLCYRIGVIHHGSNLCFKLTESTTLHPRLRSVILSLILVGRSHSYGLVSLLCFAHQHLRNIHLGLLFGCLSTLNEGPLSLLAHSGVSCVGSGACFLGRRCFHTTPTPQPHLQ